MKSARADQYSATALDHFRRPRNVGHLSDANGVGIVDDRETETYISIYVKIEAKRVVAARFRTFGCSACIAASSMATTLALGARLAAARSIDAPALLRALGGLPDGKEHCAELAASALASAIGAYRSRVESGSGT